MKGPRALNCAWSTIVSLLVCSESRRGRRPYRLLSTPRQTWLFHIRNMAQLPWSSKVTVQRLAKVPSSL